jgi:zinc finger protein
MEKNTKQKSLIILKNQLCPVCNQKKSNFTEYEIEDSFCGKIAIFSIKCNSCGYKSNDLEFLEPKSPAEYTLEINNVKDLNTRIIKSQEATITFPGLKMDVESSGNSDSYITNIEGVLLKFKSKIEFLENNLGLEKEKRKKAKTLLNKIEKILNGEIKTKIVLRDEIGNSTIISDKVKIKKLRKK